MYYTIRIGLFCLVLVCVGMSCFAHGDLHERIEAISVIIEENPDSCDLYVKRGILYFQHEDNLMAQADFNISRNMGCASKEMKQNEGKNLAALNQYERAIEVMNEVLALDPENVRSLRIKADAEFAYGCYEFAAVNYETVIRKASSTFTENYLEAAIAWERTESPEGLKKAIALLQEGMDELGNLVVLQQEMIRMYIKSGQNHKAVAIQTEIVNSMNRKENALYKRALLHFEMDDAALAKQDLFSALEAIEALPKHIQYNPATTTLKNSIKQKLGKL